MIGASLQGTSNKGLGVALSCGLHPLVGCAEQVVLMDVAVWKEEQWDGHGMGSTVGA